VSKAADVAGVVRCEAPTLDAAVEILAAGVAFGDAAVVAVDANFESSKLSHIYT